MTRTERVMRQLRALLEAFRAIAPAYRRALIVQENAGASRFQVMADVGTGRLATLYDGMSGSEARREAELRLRRRAKRVQFWRDGRLEWEKP